MGGLLSASRAVAATAGGGGLLAAAAAWSPAHDCGDTAARLHEVTADCARLGREG